MEITKTIAQWEVEKGLIVATPGDTDFDKQITEAEFDSIVEEAGEDHVFKPTERVQFLISNGYEVNRENLRDASLL